MRAKKEKKKEEAARKEIEEGKESVFVRYDFSGQVVVYLLKGGEEDLPPCSVKLFGKGNKIYSFEWMKEQCGIPFELEDADRISFSGGRNHSLCFNNAGNATIVKGNEILIRDKKYFLNYGEKILLIFSNGEVEIELHYKNIKPSER